MNGSIADAMSRELQARTNGLVHDRHQPVARDEEYTAIARVGNGISLAHAPRLAHVGTAGQHSAVEKVLIPNIRSRGPP